MSAPTYRMVKPSVSVRMYWLEVVCLALSAVTPVVAWAIWHDWTMIARSSSVMVFLAAVAEFFTLNRLHQKHLLNACRAKACEDPWDFSQPAKVVGVEGPCR
jgi:uncharacterized membrane protein YqjE